MGGASGMAAAPCALAFATPNKNLRLLKCRLDLSICLYDTTQAKANVSLFYIKTARPVVCGCPIGK